MLEVSRLELDFDIGLKLWLGLEWNLQQLHSLPLAYS